MAKKLETASINDVIRTLTNLKKELTAKGVKNAGNIPVMLSSDEEGNQGLTINNSLITTQHH